MMRMIQVLMVMFSIMTLLQTSYGAPSHLVMEDDYCEIMEMAESTLTERERERFLRFLISDSPADIDGESFYLIHFQLKGSCRDRFFAGSILAGIVLGKIEREHLDFLNESEAYVIQTILDLWRRGGIRSADLSHERELILTFEGFSLRNREELTRAAFEVEGLSHAVAFAMWTTEIPKQSPLISYLERYFAKNVGPYEKMVAGLLLLRVGNRSDFDFENISRTMNQSSEKANALQDFYRCLKERQPISFSEFDALELLPDD